MPFSFIKNGIFIQSISIGLIKDLAGMERHGMGFGSGDPGSLEKCQQKEDHQLRFDPEFVVIDRLERSRLLNCLTNSLTNFQRIF